MRKPMAAKKNETVKSLGTNSSSVTRKRASKKNKHETIARQASVQRRTKETDVSVVVDLDGTGQSQIDTRVPFFDHMLEALSKHSLVDIKIHARGDIEWTIQHTVEDVGICLGRALVAAMGDRAGMKGTVKRHCLLTKP